MFDARIDHRARHRPSRPARAAVVADALLHLPRQAQPAQTARLQQTRPQPLQSVPQQPLQQ
jgi:hypothetical protein